MLLPASLLAVTVPDFTVAASFSPSGYSQSLSGLGSSSSASLWFIIVSASAALSLFITVRVLWSFAAWVKTRGCVQLKSPNQCEAAALSLSTSAEKATLESLQSKVLTSTPSPPSTNVPPRKSPSPPPRSGPHGSTSHGSTTKSQQKPSKWRWVAAFMPSRARWAQISSSMPVNLSSLAVSKDAKLGRGVGIAEGGMRQVSPPPRPTLRRDAASDNAARRNGKAPGPTFESPVPALYQAEVPASMAKIILSRHTFRKSNPGAPRKAISSSSLQRPAV